jgi:hypothetical protein
MDPPPRAPAARDHRPPAPPPGPEPPPDPLAEAEAVRSLLQEAHARLARLLAALKHHRRQSRALEAAVASLRDLQMGR